MQIISKRNSQHKKMAISAEVYSAEHVQNFEPRVVPKTDQQLQALIEILSQNFMFSGLEERSQ